MKYYRMTWEEILWGRSFVNITMLLSTIPKNNVGEKGEKAEGGEAQDFTDLADFLDPE